MVVVQLLGRIESSNQADWRLKTVNFDNLILFQYLLVVHYPDLGPRTPFLCPPGNLSHSGTLHFQGPVTCNHLLIGCPCKLVLVICFLGPLENGHILT